MSKHGLERNAVMRLNRTFMELKPRRAVSLHDCSREFESHLYGIETRLADVAVAGRERLNRTFMELKREKRQETGTGAGRFESHLYGIETKKGSSDASKAGV